MIQEFEASAHHKQQTRPTEPVVIILAWRIRVECLTFRKQVDDVANKEYLWNSDIKFT